MKKISKLLKTSAPINVKDISDDLFKAKYRDKVRHGKTQRDHATGAWKNRLDNRIRRAQEQTSTKR